MASLDAAGDDPDLESLGPFAEGSFGHLYKVFLDMSRLTSRFGANRMDRCCLADDLTHCQIFARKIVHPFASVQPKDMEEEATAVRKLMIAGTHKNLVTIFGHGWRKMSTSNYTDDFYVVDMELCGGTLENYMQDLGPIRPNERLPPHSIWNITLQLASGLAFLHMHKLIHCDIKPANGNIHYFGLSNYKTSR